MKRKMDMLSRKEQLLCRKGSGNIRREFFDKCAWNILIMYFFVWILGWWINNMLTFFFMKRYKLFRAAYTWNCFIQFNLISRICWEDERNKIRVNDPPPRRDIKASNKFVCFFLQFIFRRTATDICRRCCPLILRLIKGSLDKLPRQLRVSVESYPRRYLFNIIY